jgi:hypothetical protein
MNNIGDPGATAPAIFKVVDTAEPPLRLVLGSIVLPNVRKQYQQRLATWEGWATVSELAQGTGAEANTVA